MVVAESRLYGLKDKEEELEIEMDPQKQSKSPRSSSAQKGDWTLINKETFRQKVLKCPSRWASVNTFTFLLIPTECFNRRWPSRAIADEDRPGWVEVCSVLHFALQVSILGLKCGKVP